MRFYITPEDYKKAEKNGISKRLLEGRVYISGWNVDRAINEPKRQWIDRKKWLEVAKQNGIKTETFYRRVNEYGMSPEEASTRKVGK